MFPHPCGADLAKAVRNGTDAKQVVPDDYVVVRGGIKPIPAIGQLFSAMVGPTLEAAGAAVPNNQLRMASVGEIRRKGGIIEWRAEHSNHGTLNEQHAHVVESGSTSSRPLLT